MNYSARVSVFVCMYTLWFFIHPNWLRTLILLYRAYFTVNYHLNLCFSPTIRFLTENYFSYI